jgi:hypothetical protein
LPVLAQAGSLPDRAAAARLAISTKPFAVACRFNDSSRARPPLDFAERETRLELDTGKALRIESESVQPRLATPRRSVESYAR